MNIRYPSISFPDIRIYPCLGVPSSDDDVGHFSRTTALERGWSFFFSVSQNILQCCNISGQCNYWPRKPKPDFRVVWAFNPKLKTLCKFLRLIQIGGGFSDYAQTDSSENFSVVKQCVDDLCQGLKRHSESEIWVTNRCTHCAFDLSRCRSRAKACYLHVSFW